MTSADPPGITFVEFFHKKCLLAMDIYIMVIPAHPHCVQVNHASDEKVKINELGPIREAFEQFLGNPLSSFPSNLCKNYKWLLRLL